MEVVLFPYWFLASTVGVTINPETGAKQLPDRFGMPTVFCGLEPCIPLFSTKQSAIAYATDHNLTECLVGALSNRNELKDIGERFKDDYTHFIIDPDTRKGLVKMSDIIGLE